MKRTPQSYMIKKTIDWLKHYTPLDHHTSSSTTKIPSTKEKVSFPYGSNVLRNHKSDSSTTATTASSSNSNNNIQRIVIYWFRLNDLRINDNQGLLHACKLSHQYFDCPIVPVFCFDSNIFYGTPKTNQTNSNHSSFLKCHARRAKFILESVNDLRSQLQTQCQSHLIVGYNTTYPQFFHTLICDLKEYYQQRHDETIKYNNDRNRIATMSNNNNNNDDDDGDDNKDGDVDNDESNLNNEQRNNKNNELQFDITIVCQDEPVREERMQVYHVSQVLQYHNNHPDDYFARYKKNPNTNSNNNSNTNTNHTNDNDVNNTSSDDNKNKSTKDEKEETYDTQLWDRINRIKDNTKTTSPFVQLSSILMQRPSSLLSNPKIVQQIWGSTMHLPKQMSMHSSFLDMPNIFVDFAQKIRRNKIHTPYDIPTEYYNMPFPIHLYPKTDILSTKTKQNGTNDDNDDSGDWTNNIITSDETATPATTSTASSSNSPNTSFPYDPLTYMPTLQDLGYTTEQIASTEIHHPNSKVKHVVGGETAGLQRIQDYIWDLDLLKHWAIMRQDPIVQNQSTLFSPYLAHGCISPRTIAVEVTRCFTKRKAQRAMVILQHELKMRDYNKFYCIKHGDGIFQKHGALPPHRRDIKPKLFLKNQDDFDIWTTGRTGYPLVDATMREISHTGYASYRCRLNAASFLVHDMKHDWRRGAQYFEEQLIDYDVYLNWWAWCDVAGFTTGRVFQRTVATHDGKKYDPRGEYVKLWIPELELVPYEYIHEPWKLTEEQQAEYNVRIGIDYPNPFLDPTIGEERRKKRAKKRERLNDMQFLRSVKNNHPHKSKAQFS